MWDKIKKAINSDLSKPLNTFIQEIHNSWATQRNRLDTSISSRATDAGVWSANGRVLSRLIPSANVKLTIAPVVSNGRINNIILRATGRIRISVEAALQSGIGNSQLILKVYSGGIETANLSQAVISHSYTTFTFDNIPIPNEHVRIELGLSGSTRNIRIMHDFNNDNLPAEI